MPNDDFNFATYQRFLADRKLMGCRCQKCGRCSLPPRPICPECRSRNMEWTELDGEGAVVGFGEIAVVPAPMAKLGYGRGRPYVSGFVTLHDGPTLPARIEAGQHPVRVGMLVQADFLEEGLGDEAHVALVFRPK